jgi:uncharacterized repeat protein (TIGR04138 family)
VARGIALSCLLRKALAMSDPEPHGLHGLEELARQRLALEAAVAKDPRYRVEAHLLVCDAVQFTVGRLPERRHVSGRELCEGLVDLALERYGYLAGLVLGRWGIRETDDVGEIVFNLIEVGLLSKTDEDTKEDFEAVFDLHHVLKERYQVLGEGTGA